MIPDHAAAETPRRPCQNCGEPLLGEHCYSCGQPTQGLVRHFSSIFGDFFDSVLGLDSRILRTIGPLLFRPGYLSEEYFAGRRVRYVSPVRLFVFLSLFAFFAAQLSFNIGVDDEGQDAIVIEDDSDTARLVSADTVPAVEAIRDKALAELALARKETEEVPGVGIGLDVASREISADAQRRIDAIRKSERTGEPLSEDSGDDGDFNFNGTPWDPESNPVEVDWLPESANGRINGTLGDAKENITRIQRDPNLLKDAFLSTVPTTLFVLLPLFALMLKLAYLFKRRLYMEHLIVALHSHSFLCAGMLLALLLDALAGWTVSLAWLSRPLGWMEVALVVWMPIYLLLMQKRVYRQGWPMTLLKFGILGTGYLVLVTLGATVSLMVSVVNM